MRHLGRHGVAGLQALVSASVLVGPTVAWWSDGLAADWPRYLGPDRTGVSPETGLARSWPEGGPRVVWTADVGPGFGGPAVSAGKVYLLDRSGDRQDVLRCLDLQTGAERWRLAYDAPGELPYPGSRQVPAVEGGRVYTVGPFGHILAVDLETHKAVWSAHVIDDFAPAAGDPKDRAKVPTWGVAQCPLIYGDVVIVAPLTAKVGVAALGKADGKVRWTSPAVGPNDFSYVTPTLVNLCGVDQVVVLANTQPGKWAPAVVASVDAASGRLLWRIETWKPYKLPISSPVAAGPDTLLVSGAYGVGCFGLKVRRDGDRWTVDYAFKDNPAATAHLHAPILYQGRLYVQSFDIHQPRAANGLVCMDVNGRVLWKSAPDAVFDAGGLLAADGLIYVIHGKTGEVCMVDARADAFRLLGRAKVLDERAGPIWAPPALSDGKLLVRDQRQLKCLEVGSP